MKILHLIYTEGMAGAERYLMHLLPPLKEHDIHCHVILVTPAHTVQLFAGYCEKMNALGIPSTIIVSKRTGYLKAATTINKYLRKNGISFVHSHLINSDILAILVKILFNRKLVLISTKHGYEEKIMIERLGQTSGDSAAKFEIRKNLYYRIAKFTLQKINYNYTISNALSLLYYNLGLTKSKMPVIYHGVTVQSPSLDNMYKLADKQLIIVARLEDMKGHRYLLQALPAVIKIFPLAKLLIIGVGSKKESLAQLADDLNIQSNIEFMGYKEDPWSYIANSDVIILPSLFEPFGLVYIEAFALHTSIVAFDTPAGNEIMENDKTALLVAARDSNALAEKIIYLLDNPEESQKMAERAYTKYLDAFSTERMVANTANYYRQVLQQ